VKIYLVGGAIRDRLLGLNPGERDWVVVGATPAALETRGFKPLDAEFPVFAHPESGEEYALARREKKIGSGHKGFSVEFGPDVTLEEDLQRRDLRVNAIAESDSHELIDPFGGRVDLNARTLRHVSPAFVEDPLRVLRAARFAARLAALDFNIHAATLDLMKTMSARDEMRSLSGNRIWQEAEKALKTSHPSRFFSLLNDCGALAVVLPELGDATEAAPAPNKAYGETPGFKALEAAAGLDPRAEVRFAALVNALSGPGTGADTETIVARLCKRLPIRRKYADLARVTSRLIRPAAFPARADAKRLLARLEGADAFRRPGRFKDALLVCQALESITTSGGEDAAPTAILHRAFDAAAEISAAEVTKSGVRGEAVGIELARRRTEAIEKILAGGAAV
jgi:tRNA nucleotidyltransferase (CCA-adding enzyme)